MIQGPKQYPADYWLLTAISEPQARQRVSKAQNLRSGAIPVLVAVAVTTRLGYAASSRSLHQARLVSPSLLRDYLRELVAAELVERYVHRGYARLRLTSKGHSVCSDYQRFLLGGARQYERELSIT